MARTRNRWLSGTRRQQDETKQLTVEWPTGYEEMFFCSLVQGGAEKRKNLKFTMRFRPAVKFLLHTQYTRGFVTLKRLVRL
jgi:hypothetical protein